MIGEVHHLGHAELAARLTAAGQRVDALIVDAPYSARTHSGHDDGTASANRVADWAARREAKGLGSIHGTPRARAECAARKGKERRAINYRPWTVEDVTAFVSAWVPLVDGWIVSITDHGLAPAWIAALEDVDRYVFAPLPFVAPGSRIRLPGDGPPAWSCWIIVARPKSRAWATWTTTEAREKRGAAPVPGAYVLPPGEGGSMPVAGGKPLWLMRALVRDYSRPDDLVCDPCAGAGTTLLAAKLEGRRWIGGDIDEDHVRISRARLADTPIEDRKGTLPLFAR